MSNDEFNYDNEIIEIGVEKTNEQPVVEFEDDLEAIPPTFEEKKTKKKENKPKKKMDNPFIKIKDWFLSLSKKGKIITISVASLVLLLLIGVIVYFVFIKKDEKPIDNVVVEQDNYRYENGKLIFLDGKKELGEYECTDKSEKKCYVAYLNNDEDLFDHPSNIDYKGNTLKERSEIYLKKYAFVYDDGKITLYDIENKKSKKKFLSIKAYDTDRDLVVVEDKDNKFGVIEFMDDNFEYVINAYYDYLGIINAKDLLLVSETDKKQRIIDIDNKNLSKEFSINIKSASKEYIAAQSGASYNLYSYNFEELMSGYDFISFHNEYVGLVKDKKLFFVDKDLNKMNEEGLELTSTNYNSIYKYDKKNKLDETDVAYKVTTNSDNIAVEYGKKNKIINIFEGIVSKEYAYISYFDGKLYFYGDAEKTDLLGSYACTNKNTLASATDGLSNCMIYTSDAGATGIYNNNFVFIKDGTDGNIILYSITENKKKATYTSIELVNKDNVSGNISTYQSDSVFVIAKSASKGNFGVIKLDSSKASNVVSFNYKSVTKTSNNYYLLQNVDNKYSLWDATFSKVSEEFDYIETLTNYYVGIKDKKLNIYKYDPSATKILQSDVMLSGTDYKNAYSINIGTNIVITIDGVPKKYNILTGEEIALDLHKEGD